MKGVAGTRNCEWWLTNEAVILDTAGRYTTEDNDRDEWLAFLDMLAKNRPRRPLNGLLVAVSVGDFVELDEEGSAALGQRIRERIDEVMTRLKMVLPVYVLFTKCDLLAGFVETFGELSKNERGQIWGFTLPVAEGKAPANGSAELFDELSTQVSAWSLDRLAKARRLEDRERIFQFPAQFEALRSNLSEFIQTVFVANVYQDTPLLRGVYFTSGTQEGRPIDRVMRAMASAFGLQGAVPEAEAAPQDPKSYFLRDVFGKVIFKDRSLAVRSASASRRDQLLQRAYTIGGLGLAALLIVLPTVSFFRNLSLVHSTRDLVAGLKGKLGSSTATLKALTPLRTRLEELLVTKHDGAPLSMRFGMWQGDAVLEELRPFYGTTVRDLVVKQVLDLSDGDLAEFVKAPPPKLVARTHLPYWEALKLHLLLTSPREDGEPPLDDATQEWMLARITRPYFARALAESSEEGEALQLARGDLSPAPGAGPRAGAAPRRAAGGAEPDGPPRAPPGRPGAGAGHRRRGTAAGRSHPQWSPRREPARVHLQGAGPGRVHQAGLHREGRRAPQVGHEGRRRLGPGRAGRRRLHARGSRVRVLQGLHRRVARLPRIHRARSHARRPGQGAGPAGRPDRRHHPAAVGALRARRGQHAPRGAGGARSAWTSRTGSSRSWRPPRRLRCRCPRATATTRTGSSPPPTCDSSSSRSPASG